MKYLLTAIVTALVVVLGFNYFNSPKLGNVITQGIVPTVATSSQIVVGPQSVTTLFAKNSSCTSRLVSTVGTAVMLSFSSAVTPTGTAGAVQAASTSVSYDNANYGCGAITAYAAASTTITLTEFSQ